MNLLTCSLCVSLQCPAYWVHYRLQGSEVSRHANFVKKNTRLWSLWRFYCSTLYPLALERAWVQTFVCVWNKCTSVSDLAFALNPVWIRVIIVLKITLVFISVKSYFFSTVSFSFVLVFAGCNNPGINRVKLSLTVVFLSLYCSVSMA